MLGTPVTKRLARALLGAGLLFLLLGAGNIVLGSKRLAYFELAQLQDQSRMRSASTRALEQQSPDSEISESRGTRHPISESGREEGDLRIQFYRLCVLGGKVFLALAALFFLLGLFFLHTARIEVVHPETDPGPS